MRLLTKKALLNRVLSCSESNQYIIEIVNSLSWPGRLLALRSAPLIPPNFGRGFKWIENHDSLSMYVAPPRPRMPAIRIAQDGLSRLVDAAGGTPPIQQRFGRGNEMIQPKSAHQQHEDERKRNQQRVPAGKENVLIHPGPPIGRSRHMSGFSCGHTAYRPRIGKVLGTEVTEEQGPGT